MAETVVFTESGRCYHRKPCGNVDDGSTLSGDLDTVRHTQLSPCTFCLAERNLSKADGRRLRVVRGEPLAVDLDTREVVELGGEVSD